MKKKLIEKIKKIISEIGSTSTGEMQSESSQVYKNQAAHHSCSLVESYNAENITVVDYVHEQEVHQFYAPYEDLKAWQLRTGLGEVAVFEKQKLNNIMELISDIQLK